MAVDSFNTRTGAVVSASGDYSVTQLATTTADRLFGTSGAGASGLIALGNGLLLSSSTLVTTQWTTSGSNIYSALGGNVGIGMPESSLSELQVWHTAQRPSGDRPLLKRLALSFLATKTEPSRRKALKVPLRVSADPQSLRMNTPSSVTLPSFGRDIFPSAMIVFPSSKSQRPRRD